MLKKKDFIDNEDLLSFVPYWMSTMADFIQEPKNLIQRGIYRVSALEQDIQTLTKLVDSCMRSYFNIFFTFLLPYIILIIVSLSYLVDSSVRSYFNILFKKLIISKSKIVLVSFTHENKRSFILY
jgi:hypothetical protein